jgi:drug/metabolite transporter (DMT)-like permease
MKNETGSMGLTEWLSLLTLSILWGGSFFFVGFAVNAIPPLTLVALRVGLAAIALHFFTQGGPKKHLSQRHKDTEEGTSLVTGFLFRLGKTGFLRALCASVRNWS